MEKEELEEMAISNRTRITALEAALPFLATREQIQQLVAEQIMNRFLLGGCLVAIVANVALTYLRG